MKFSNQYLTAVRRDFCGGSNYALITDYIIPALILWLGRKTLAFRNVKVITGLETFQVAILAYFILDLNSGGMSIAFSLIVLCFFTDVMSRLNAIFLRGLGDHVQRVMAKVALAEHKRNLAREAGVLV